MFGLVPLTFVITSVWFPGSRVGELKNIWLSLNNPGASTGAVYVPTTLPSMAYVVVGTP